MISVLIAGDDLLVSLGIVRCVRWAELNIVLIGVAKDSEEAWKLYKEYAPDILIIDVCIPDLYGLELIRKVRAVDQYCKIILLTNVQDESVLDEVRRLDVSDILFRKSLKQEDISTAVQKVCASINDKNRISADEKQTEKTGKTDLSEDFYGDLSFKVRGVTGFSLLSGNRLNPALLRSLYALLVERLGEKEAYVLVSKENCQVLVWKEPPPKQMAAEKLLAFARDVQSLFDIRMGIVSVFDELSSSQIARLVFEFVLLLRDASLFDYPILWVDKYGHYNNHRLNILKNELVIYHPLYADSIKLMILKAYLDRYPGNLEEGFARIKDNAAPLLSELGLPSSWNGIWEMTEQICSKASERLAGSVGKIRPEIKNVMDYIRVHLADNLSLENISKYVGFDSAYFSKVFKAEVHINYSDYLSQMRLLRAMELLVETADPVSTVAEACGFSNLPYFSSRFHKYCGMTPSEWRDQKRTANIRGNIGK